MFVGHYGVSFAAKKADLSIPLWVLFLAVQMLDVGWSVFVLLGIEKVRIVPGITATNPLDLYYMPYTHSLVAALAWSVAAGAAYAQWRRGAPQAALLVGVAVFSHWPLDFIVHRPDLPLWDNTAKVGLGLWNAPLVALGLEVASLFGGMWLFFRSGLKRRVPLVVFGLAMVAIQAVVFFGPPPASPRGAAVTALLAYFIFAGVIHLLEWGARGPSAAARNP